MIEEIMKNAPEGATHWQAGFYYKENEYGVWSMWKGYWESSFQWPSDFMTPLISDKSNAGKWSWEIQQDQRALISELQKRVDIAESKLHLVQECIEENSYSNMRSGGLVIQVAELEQALKGGESC